MMLSAEGVDVVRRFCDTVSDRNIQSLELLRAIDGIVDWLSGLQDTTNGDLKHAQKLIEIIQKSEFVQEIDPDGVHIGRLSQAESTIGRLISLLERGRQSALDDDDLTGDHEQCVVDEYDATISAYSALQEKIAELKSSIEKHDAELGELVGPFDSAEELIASLEE